MQNSHERRNSPSEDNNTGLNVETSHSSHNERRENRTSDVKVSPVRHDKQNTSESDRRHSNDENFYPEEEQSTARHRRQNTSESGHPSKDKKVKSGRPNEVVSAKANAPESENCSKDKEISPVRHGRQNTSVSGQRHSEDEKIKFDKEASLVRHIRQNTSESSQYHCKDDRIQSEEEVPTVQLSKHITLESNGCHSQDEKIELADKEVSSVRHNRQSRPASESDGRHSKDEKVKSSENELSVRHDRQSTSKSDGHYSDKHHSKSEKIKSDKEVSSVGHARQGTSESGRHSKDEKLKSADDDTPVRLGRQNISENYQCHSRYEKIKSSGGKISPVRHDRQNASESDSRRSWDENFKSSKKEGSSVRHGRRNTSEGDRRHSKDEKRIFNKEVGRPNASENDRRYSKGEKIKSSDMEVSLVWHGRQSTKESNGHSKNDQLKYSEFSKDAEPKFPFSTYRQELRHIWFSDNNFLDQDDFWKFVRRYEEVKKQTSPKAASSDTCDSAGGEHPLGLPENFSLNHLLPVRLASSVDDDFKRLPAQVLSREQLAEFRDILYLYLDFKQREKFTKLKKLRKSQADLPVAKFREEIVSSVQNNRVVIIAGDTGCGKSTQVPQYLLKAGFNKIVCTQPRRIACISLCKRVAYETLNEYGSQIGFQIRFEKSKTQHTRIVFVTEGLLLRQVSTDPSLSGYDVVVLDEVHERHLHGDFLLGVVKCLLYQRSDIKIVLMSATINIELFSDYFGDHAAVIQVPGRLYPIRTIYQPVSAEERASKSSSKSTRIDPAPYVRIMQQIDEKYPKEEKGDLLIFLSGMSEISTVVEAAKQYALQKHGWIILPLHSTLSISEQDKCFDYSPEGVRKCVVSTNIAETSITIDGIRFVVDSGKVKEMSYDSVCKMQRLKEFWISRASAEQRKGRAGRTGPGVCYRLYPEEEYRAMSEYTTPEILRVPLDSLLLQMVSMGLPDARKFPFIESPPANSIENAIITLKQQGALTEDEKLTVMGSMLSRLPVDISLGKMLIMGSLFHQVEPVLSLAAALSVQSPFTNRSYRDPDCETSRKELESDHGDPITLLNALREWLEMKNPSNCCGGAGSRKWCRRRGLEEQRFYEMVKLRGQFKDLLQDAGLLKIPVVAVDQMSSAERALRHGELQILKSMKRSFKESAPQRRKVLKLDPFELGSEGREEIAGEVDIKDVEFRLNNSSYQVRNLVTGATACSYKDVMMLKVILCAGLYPQLAVADEFNQSKSVSEQLFHTPGKAYVALHPNGFFGNHPDVLHLEESDIVVPEKFSSKLPASSRHQLLCYMSLLETTKPYLVTTMRMPAAQTLLLFAQSIDTSVDFSRLVCDSWLQLEFPVPEAAMALLLKVTKLRNKWEQLLQLRLQDVVPSVENKAANAATTASLEQELSTELPQFMHTEVVYTLKRLLAADSKVLHKGPEQEDDCWPVGPNPFHDTWEMCPHPIKGGIQVTSYITYNCLVSKGEDVQYETWRCPKCDLVASFSMFEQLQHRHACKVEKEAEKASKAEDEHSLPKKFNSELFKCEKCRKTFYYSPTEILRHKKLHK